MCRQGVSEFPRTWAAGDRGAVKFLLPQKNQTGKFSNAMNIDIKVERWPIDRLIPRVNNPRDHSREQIANIAASMKEFGWTNPILVDGNDGILAGHARVLAARKLKMKEVPVIVLAHLTEAQRRALVIADNQLAIAGAGWDEEKLRIELAVLHEEDYNLDLVGFDDVELARLLEAEDATAGTGARTLDASYGHDYRTGQLL